MDLRCPAPQRLPIFYLRSSSHCFQGYYPFNGDCAECRGVHWGLLLAALVVGLLYITGFHFLAQSTNPLSQIFFYFGASACPTLWCFFHA